VIERQGRHSPMIAPTYCRFTRSVHYDRKDDFLTNTSVLWDRSGFRFWENKKPSMLARVSLRIVSLRWLVRGYSENEASGNINRGTCGRSTQPYLRRWTFDEAYCGQSRSLHGFKNHTVLKIHFTRFVLNSKCGETGPNLSRVKICMHVLFSRLGRC
jgi:hypothetical protein